MFQLTKREFSDLRSQIVMSSWGGRRYPPYAFTEQGVAMLSGVLRSKRAIHAWPVFDNYLINQYVMRQPSFSHH
jgi:hypothetical protein